MDLYRNYIRFSRKSIYVSHRWWKSIISFEELEFVDHDLFKWICSGKNCCRSTKVRDYGIQPIYYHKRITPHFMNMNHYYFMCAKHYKIYKDLIKNHPANKVRDKLFDFSKLRLIKI